MGAHCNAKFKRRPQVKHVALYDGDGGGRQVVTMVSLAVWVQHVLHNSNITCRAKPKGEVASTHASRLCTALAEHKAAARPT